MAPLFEIEMEIPMPGSRDARLPTSMTRQQRNPEPTVTTRYFKAAKNTKQSH
jgi:hypothetical protein